MTERVPAYDDNSEATTQEFAVVTETSTAPTQTGADGRQIGTAPESRR